MKKSMHKIIDKLYYMEELSERRKIVAHSCLDKFKTGDELDAAEVSLEYFRDCDPTFRSTKCQTCGYDWTPFVDFLKFFTSV